VCRRSSLVASNFLISGNAAGSEPGAYDYDGNTVQWPVVVVYESDWCRKKLIEHVCANPTCKYKGPDFLKNLIEIKGPDVNEGEVVVRTCPKCGTFFGPIQ